MVGRVTIETQCECGWRIVAVDGQRIRCGRCGAMVYVGRVGLGDWLERRLGAFGWWYKRTWRRWTGRDCGCDRRRAWLNRAGAAVKRYFRRLWRRVTPTEGSP